MQLRISNPRHAFAVESFTSKAVRNQVVVTVSGLDGLARVASPTRKGREVTLVWSERSEAERWAASIAQKPRINPITLVNFLKDVLPKLQTYGRAVGTDWSAEPCEPELEPFELSRRLRLEIAQAFIRDAVAGRCVFILEDDHGPVFAASTTIPNQLVLPCWTDRLLAEQHQTGFWAEAAISRIDLETFITRTLVWLEGIGRRVSPSYRIGVSGVEPAAADLMNQLAIARRSADFV